MEPVRAEVSAVDQMPASSIRINKTIQLLNLEKVQRQTLPLRQFQIPNTMMRRFRAVSSLGFKGVQPGRLPFGDFLSIQNRSLNARALLSTAPGLQKGGFRIAVYRSALLISSEPCSQVQEKEKHMPNPRGGQIGRQTFVR